MGLLLAFAITLPVLEWFRQSAVLKLGHRLDGRLRLIALSRLPKLSSQYFQRFSAGDLIECLYSVRAANQIPLLISWVAFYFCQLIFTAAGVVFLDWFSGILALLKVGANALIMKVNDQLGSEEQRARTYLGLLSRFYMDSMLGLVAIRTHSAERTIQRECEGHLSEWVKTKLTVLRRQLWLEVFVSPGERITVAEATITRDQYGPVTAIAWWDDQYEDPIYLVSSLCILEDPCDWYSLRFTIETLFSDQKSRGFHLHFYPVTSTQSTHEHFNQKSNWHPHKNAFLLPRLCYNLTSTG